jgi:glycosyltransferase involved in cell wall biosynthesis
MTAPRLKVLTMVDRLGTAGGGERLAMQIAIGLDPERFERTLCITRWPGRYGTAERPEEILAGLDAAGVRFVGLRRGARHHLWEWWPLFTLLRRGRFDVLHTHLFGSNVWGSVLGRLAGVRVIVAHEHTWSFEGRPLRKLLDRHVVARCADVFVAVSQADRRRMIEIEGIPPEVVTFVSNGVTPAAAATEHDVRAELGLQGAGPVIGTVGVLRPQKALDVLIRASAILAREFAGLKVLVAGDGPERARLERLVDELGLRETVVLLGMRRDVPDLLAALDVVAFSSDFEGSPISVMEAMAASKPIVATRVGGVPDLIEQGVHGLLVETQDARALAEAVSELLRDPERAREMGCRGHDRQRREFTLSATIATVERLYEELYAASARRRGLARLKR